MGHAEWMTLEQVSEILDLPLSEVHDLVVTHQLPAVLREEQEDISRWYVRRDNLTAFLPGESARA